MVFLTGINLLNAQAICLAPQAIDHSSTSVWSSIGLAAWLQNRQAL